MKFIPADKERINGFVADGVSANPLGIRWKNLLQGAMDEVYQGKNEK
jgi:hypothetical protein